uniref:Pentacotripeptide-repeat region of PRORP domain-containing protein n=1 Tax=Chlamydomonas euryale TaxID=1486919 RepID=A0A7R9V574_9CHLO
MAGEIYNQGNELTDEEQRQLDILAATTRRIKELGAKGRTKEAIRTLADLSKEGIEPDTLAATTLVRACTRDMALAQSVFDELFVDFLQPDEVTFAVLLRGYGDCVPPRWTDMDAALTRMKKTYGIEPTSTSYNVLLNVCASTNDLDRGQDVIDRMLSDDVDPDEFSLEAVSKRRALRSYLKKSFGL